jgi:CRISPR type IV-associated protein Csf3
MYNPLHITAYLQTPVVSDASLPLDGILHYLVHRDAYGHQDATLPGAATDVKHVNAPLLIKRRGQPTWYYAASWAQWSGSVALGTDHWTKRFDAKHSDMVNFSGKRGKVIVEQGAYKAYHMPVFVRHAVQVSWYAVGNGAEIRRLLRYATHIGKKTAQGYGAVLRWEVEPWHEDWSERSPQGRLMRPIPAASGPLVGYRPSYWLPKNQAPCMVPQEETYG